MHSLIEEPNNAWVCQSVFVLPKGSKSVRDLLWNVINFNTTVCFREPVPLKIVALT